MPPSRASSSSSPAATTARSSTTPSSRAWPCAGSTARSPGRSPRGRLVAAEALEGVVDALPDLVDGVADPRRRLVERLVDGIGQRLGRWPSPRSMPSCCVVWSTPSTSPPTGPVVVRRCGGQGGLQWSSACPGSRRPSAARGSSPARPAAGAHPVRPRPSAASAAGGSGAGVAATARGAPPTAVAAAAGAAAGADLEAVAARPRAAREAVERDQRRDAEEGDDRAADERRRRPGAGEVAADVADA